ELHPLELAVDRAGKRLTQRSLTDAGNALDKQVSAGKDADQGQPDDVVFAANHAAQRLFQFGSLVGHGNSSFGRHLFDSTSWQRVGWSYGSHRSYEQRAMSYEECAMS